MAPIKPIKTYSRQNRSINSSLDLFANLITKKSTSTTGKFKGKNKKNGRKKIQIKELPPRSRNENFLENDSIDVSVDNTFDKLLKGANLNNVKVKNKISKVDSSQSDISQTKPALVEITNEFHSPVIKRSKKITRDIKKNCSFSSRRNSPILTRNKSKSASNFQTSYTLPEAKSDVNESLSIEVVRQERNEFPSLSYIKLPQIKEHEVSNNSNNNEDSNSRIFTNSVREKILIHSSTPAGPTIKHKTVVCDAISPITNNMSTKENSIENRIMESDDTNVSSKIEPDFDNGNTESNIKNTISDRQINEPHDNIVMTDNTKKSFITLRNRKIFTNISKIKSFDFDTSDCPPASSGLIKERLHDDSRNISESNVTPVNFVTERKRSKIDTDQCGKFSKELVISLTNLRLPVDNESSKITTMEISDIERSLKEGRELIINATKMDCDKIDGSSMKTDTNNTSLAEKNDSNQTNNASIYFSENVLPNNLIIKELVVKLPAIKLEKNISPKFQNSTIKEHSNSNIPDEIVVPKIETSEVNSQNLSDIIETSEIEGTFIRMPNIVRKRPSKTFMLKSGKSWRRSLSMYRKSSLLRNTLLANARPCQLPNNSLCKCPKCSLASLTARLSIRRQSIKIVPVAPLLPNSPTIRSNETSILENYAQSRQSTTGAGYEPSESGIEGPEQQHGVYEGPTAEIYEFGHKEKGREDFQGAVTAREVVLRKCGQVEPLAFEQCYPESRLEHCQKIGEGVYGEVFLFRNAEGGTTVMKVIPIEGDLMVNGERQKRFEEIISEIVIATELSNLRHENNNSTTGFSEVKKIRCTYGRYPNRLLDLWELYDETRGSENDSPEIFGDNQLYIVLELANGGKDLEAFILTNALQAYCVFKQVACALAVAESSLGFEHRDLHWGNILLTNVDRKKSVTFKLNGRDIEIDTGGVEVSIIDFTLSRIECDGVVMYNDLGQDEELFTAEGDYQFEIYRLMRDRNSNEWESFHPYTNLLWLHYVLDKAISALRYKNGNGKIHREYLDHLGDIKEDILSFGGAKEFVEAYF